MKLTHCLSAGLLSLTLLSGVSAVNAKPQIVEDLEKLLPHNQIKRHIERKEDKGRRFYNDDRRSHTDKKNHKHDRHYSHGNGRHDSGHGKYGKHSKHNRYYNGWSNNGRDRYNTYRYDRHDRRYYHDDHRPHPSAGYWNDHRRHGYRHKRHNGHSYYYDRAGFFFPGFGLIEHGHRHGRHCPEWHLQPFVAGVVLSAILNH